MIWPEPFDPARILADQLEAGALLHDVGAAAFADPGQALVGLASMTTDIGGSD